MTETMTIKLVVLFEQVTEIKLNPDTFCWSYKADISRQYIKIDAKLFFLQFARTINTIVKQVMSRNLHEKI